MSVSNHRSSNVDERPGRSAHRPRLEADFVDRFAALLVAILVLGLLVGGVVLNFL